ncbi:VWA domain-containing protein [Cryptosporangium phraense]|uniref:VWA domain-containing protein n=1 Tax=Cryptosporangium phraense TaxID=2593070 RepID=A0A545AH40_9ACTN|nr:VWA domain-containing protein [Cryptosporangium phraense]TQS40642.1 VWA domain-containing protein [Cryptosporangium phraense]
MTSPSQVSIETHQNEYLPAGGRTVDAVVTVTGSESAAQPRAVSRSSTAEMILIDVSASMSGAKLQAAKQAAAAAIDTLPDGVAFGIVAGDTGAWPVYPSRNRLATSSAANRAEARDAVSRLRTKGGTAIGAWLTLAAEMFGQRGAALNHAILLTDGANGEDGPTFDRALDRCEGLFVCDSRGIGDGWVARDLIKVAERLLGTASGIVDPDALTADFLAMTEAAMGKTMADVVLRVWTPAGAGVRFLKQVFPEIVDLTGRRTDLTKRVGAYPIGSWGAESRDYHLRVDVEPGELGEEILAARVSVVHGDDVLGQSLVRAIWTDDLSSTTTINGRVAHYTDATELADAIREGTEAQKAGDLERATAKLGRAVQLATASGQEGTAKMLAEVVEVVDAPSGTVRLRRRGASSASELLEVTSRKTQQIRPARP